MGEVFLVTDDWLDQWASVRGGWTRAQLAALGVSWPPRRGWRQQVVGQAIPVAAQVAFEVSKVAVVDGTVRRREKPTLEPGLRSEVHACKRAVRHVEERLATYAEVEESWTPEELWRLWTSIRHDLATVGIRLGVVTRAMLRQEEPDGHW